MGAALLVVQGVLTIRSLNRPARYPTVDQHVEPAHDVVYWFTAAGSANEDFKISYTDGAGYERRLNLPGVVPGWRQEIHTQKGLPHLYLSVDGHSSDYKFKLHCTVEIDGYVEESSSAGPSCQIQVLFPRKSGPRSPAQKPSAYAQKPSASASQSLGASCRFVSSAEMLTIVQETAGVIKPVQAAGGDERTCRYLLDVDTGWVEISWTPGSKDRPLPGSVRVPELGVPAYWIDYGAAATLEVFMPRGLFTVRTLFFELQIDRKTTAIRVFQVARPRLV